MGRYRDFKNRPLTAIIAPFQKAVRLLSSVVEQLTCNEQVIRSNRIGGSILLYLANSNSLLEFPYERIPI